MIPQFACHWLTEAANVWSTTLGDAHRAARALMIAIDRDPTQATPADRLAELYREKGDTKALVALARATRQGAHAARAARARAARTTRDLARRARSALAKSAARSAQESDRELQARGRVRRRESILDLRDPRAVQGAGSVERGRALTSRLEQALVTDPERKIALYQDEGDVRKNALDFAGSAHAYRRARELEGGQDATLKQQLGERLARARASRSKRARARARRRRRAVRGVGRGVRGRTRAVLFAVRARARRPSTIAPCSWRCSTASSSIAPRRSRRARPPT